MIILLKIWKSLFLFWNEDYRHGKKAWTRGQCPRKLLRIVEIFGTWKIIYSYFVEKPYILRKILNIWQNYRLWTMISTIFLNFLHNLICLFAEIWIFNKTCLRKDQHFFPVWKTTIVCFLLHETFEEKDFYSKFCQRKNPLFDSYCFKYNVRNRLFYKRLGHSCSE